MFMAGNFCLATNSGRVSSSAPHKPLPPASETHFKEFVSICAPCATSGSSALAAFRRPTGCGFGKQMWKKRRWSSGCNRKGNSSQSPGSGQESVRRRAHHAGGASHGDRSDSSNSEKCPAVMGDLSVVASNKTIVDAQTAPAHRFCCGGNVEALSWRNESSLFTSIGLTR
jgi:hypothetical protein